jgi:hypothetical protein
MNDLWMYNITSNQWSWLSGQTFVPGISAPGTSITSSFSTGVPSGRMRTVLFPSSSGQRIRLFGGNSALEGYRNDLIEFDINLLQWRQLAANLATNTGVFGSLGDFSPSTFPALAWQMNSMFYLREDNLDQLYVFGGQNEVGGNVFSLNFLNTISCINYRSIVVV